MNEKLKDYENTERILGAKLFSIIPSIKTYYFSSGKICYDTIITLKNEKKILGEIKVRNFEINKYNTYILEASKLVSLIHKYKQTQCEQIYYINFFKNKYEGLNDFIVFDLTPRIEGWKKVRPNIVKMWMNLATYESTSRKVEKDVILLEYDEKIDMKGIMSNN